MKALSEPLVTRSRPESKMEVDETPRATGRIYLDRVAQEKINEGLETWTPPEPMLSLRDLSLSQTKHPVRPEVARVAREIRASRSYNRDCNQESPKAPHRKENRSLGRRNQWGIRSFRITRRKSMGDTTDTTRRTGRAPNGKVLRARSFW